MFNDFSFGDNNDSEKKRRDHNIDDDYDEEDNININNNNSNNILRSTFFPGFPRLPFIPGFHPPFLHPWNLRSSPSILISKSISPKIPFQGVASLDPLHPVNIRTCSPGFSGLTSTSVVLEDGNKTNLSKWQQHQLESFFTRQHYPNKEAVKELSAWLGLSENKLQIWFQNRRAKHRRMEHTRKKPGRPSLAHPPTNCSGVPIPEEEVKKRKRRSRSKKIASRHADDITVKDEPSESGWITGCNQTFSRDDSGVRGAEMDYNEADSTSDTCDVNRRESQHFIPVSNPCTISRCESDDEEDDFIDVCSSPLHHSTPHAPGFKTHERSLIDSGIDSFSSSLLQQELTSSSSSGLDLRSSTSKRSSTTAKKLLFGIDSILGLDS